MFMKCLWGFFAGMLLACCAAIAVLIIAAIVAKLFTVAPDEYLVFWLAAVGIPSVIVIACVLAPMIRAFREKKLSSPKERT
jgi:hypothetical protein